MLWGTNKFMKKLIKPWAVNNNELADFISRVPDNEELVSNNISICLIYISGPSDPSLFYFLEKLQRDNGRG